MVIICDLTNFPLSGPPREVQQVRQGGVGLLNCSLKTQFKDGARSSRRVCSRLLYTKIAVK